MFTPQSNTPRPKFSAFTPGKGAFTGTPKRRTSALFATPKRSPFTARNQSLNKSLQASQILEETAHHKLEVYETPLPVLVEEALRSSRKVGENQVKINAAGYIWLIVSRKICIWYFKAGSSKAPVCRELILPPSELSHSAELVTLLQNPGERESIGCVAVSPDGTIRYWSNITHSATFIETNADLQGEEAHSLISLDKNTCILGTTTSTLHLLTTGHKEIKARRLRLPSGMLSGIGRRMSSLIFGSIPSQAMGAPLHKMLPDEDDDDAFFVLSGNHLQKWSVDGGVENVVLSQLADVHISGNNGNFLVYQCEVDKLMREAFADSIWKQPIGRLHGMKSWLVDMQSTRNGIIIIGAAVNLDTGTDLHYALGELHTDGNDSPQSFLSFTVSKHTSQYDEDDESAISQYNLLLPDPSVSSAYIYNAKSVFCLSVSDHSQPIDRVDFHHGNDMILGAGQCDGTALFFSNTHGLVSLRRGADVNMSLSDSMMDASLKPETSLCSGVTHAKLKEMSICEDKTAQLKAAFLFACKGQTDEAQSVVEDLFPSGVTTTGRTTSAMDETVSQLSQDLVDDFPASDPRWAESVRRDIGSSTHSLIIHNQLQDKLKAHELYVNFLNQQQNVWGRLSCVKIRDSLMPTKLMLCEHAEKLVAAMALKRIHSEVPQMIDTAIDKILAQRENVEAPPGLPAIDVFYREVSKVDEVLDAIVSQEFEDLEHELEIEELLLVVTTVNKLLVSMMHDAGQYRTAKSKLFQSDIGNRKTDVEYIPWTATEGPQGVRTILLKQHELTLEQAIPRAGDSQEKNKLYQQLMDLTDSVLDGYRIQLESVRQNMTDTNRIIELSRRFEQQREKLIGAFLKLKQYERAAQLAEKYCDFGILIELCEETDNQERLHRYMNQFLNKGFADFLFKWYVSHGKRGKLMNSTLAGHPQLSHFLQTGDNLFMSWLHDINAGDFYRAHSTLYELAGRETEFLSRKKTLLSMSKLAALASDDPPEDVQHKVEDINNEQDLISQQEALPKEVLESLGMDGDNMKVFSPKELIELYTSQYNVNANEYDFKKALDLLQYIDKTDPESDYENLALTIWSRAVCRDEWGTFTAENGLQQSKNTVFFRTIELAAAGGMDVSSILPTADKLLGTDLQVERSKDFEYLLKANYEEISRVMPS